MHFWKKHMNNIIKILSVVVLAIAPVVAMAQTSTTPASVDSTGKATKTTTTPAKPTSATPAAKPATPAAKPATTTPTTVPATTAPKS